ncbi:MAG: hypothetical protein NTW69_16355 [Chloroflexi bacterium]|nr:hypothetical protein [Chloroflexota bacterium]
MKCKKITPSGARCNANARKNNQYCFTHDPASSGEAAAARKKGGERHRVGHAGDTAKLPATVRTLEDVLSVLDYSLAECLPMENSIQRGRLLVAICGAFVEAIKTGELEKRIQSLEFALKSREVTQ